MQDGKVLEEARQAAIAVFSADPGLARPEHAALATAAKAWTNRTTPTEAS
ncbi:MAG: hypothetical protein H0W86_02250 [Armatimonadetes bacterium]|nr:hypothetical protein [Armatimonadota bacterium]